MKRFPILVFFILTSFISAQKIEMQTLLKDKISIRALQIWDGKVWYSGTDSKFGYVSLRDTADKKQIRLSSEKLQFRTLAQDKSHFFAINIESPAYFFKINKRSLKFKTVFKDPVKTAFYDALFVVENRLAYAFSDPDTNNQFKLLKIRLFTDSSWGFEDFKGKLLLTEGEAAFAASNTNMSSKGDYLWMATGGMKSRIFRFNKNHPEVSYEIFETPFIQGTSSQGIYSIDFYDQNFGIAVGGDYTKQAENINNIATTDDGGETWQIQASGKNGGYKTCVKIRPGSKGKEIIAVGDQNIEFSSDYGKTWTTISDEKGLYVCDWIGRNTLVFAGKDRIVKMALRF